MPTCPPARYGFADLRDSSFGSSRRSRPKLTKRTLRRSFVLIVSPVKPAFLKIAGLWCTENLPKLFSFIEKPSSSRWLMSSFKTRNDHAD